MGEKKKVPELRFPSFLNDWIVQSLSDLLTFKNGINASREDYGSGYKFINVLDIIENDFITHDRIIGCVNVSKENFEKNIVEFGDVLFQRSSETREEVGQANVYLDRNKAATFGGFVIRGKKKNEYNPVFLNYLLKTNRVRKNVTSRSGGSTRYNIGQDSLSLVNIHTTDLNEQQKIAEFLSAVDKKLDLLQKKKRGLEQYRKGVMQKIFSQELRFKDALGREFPEWEEKRLNEVVQIGSGRDYKHLNSGDIPVFGTGGLMLHVNEYFMEGESVFIGRKGTIDKPAYFEGKFWTVDTLFYTYGFKGVLPKFLYNCFLNINWLKYNEASGVPSLSKSTIYKVKISLPGVEEQTKIASFLTAIDKKITAVESQLQGTREFKKGLLQKMFV